MQQTSLFAGNMFTKLVVVLSVFLVVAAQAAPPKQSHAVPHLGYGVPELERWQSRIIGGEDAAKGEFPHQVSLQWAQSYTSRFKHFCGGSIINNTWILTAGHCAGAVPEGFGVFVIKAGKQNIHKIEDSEQVVEVESKIIHKKYIGGGRAAPYDIALLKLSKPLQLNKYVKAIKVPESNEKPTGDSQLSGWGSTSINGDLLASELQKVTLPLIDHDECYRRFANIISEVPLHRTNICTGSNDGTVSACSGDSGGPLIKENASGENEVIGIVSWGVIPCGYRNSPSVFVQVSEFKDWIEEQIAAN